MKMLPDEKEFFDMGSKVGHACHDTRLQSAFDFGKSIGTYFALKDGCKDNLAGGKEDYYDDFDDEVGHTQPKAGREDAYMEYRTCKGWYTFNTWHHREQLKKKEEEKQKTIMALGNMLYNVMERVGGELPANSTEAKNNWEPFLETSTVERTPDGNFRFKFGGLFLKRKTISCNSNRK